MGMQENHVGDKKKPQPSSERGHRQCVLKRRGLTPLGFPISFPALALPTSNADSTAPNDGLRILNRQARAFFLLSGAQD